MYIYIHTILHVNHLKADEIYHQHDNILKLELLEAAIEKQKNDVKNHAPPKPIVGAVVPGSIVPGAFATQQPLQQDEVEESGSETEVLDGLELLNDSDDGI